jgi:hypothetical protein
VEDLANEELDSNGSRRGTSPSRPQPLRIQAYTISDIYAAVPASAAEHARNLYRSSSCGATMTNRGRGDLHTMYITVRGQSNTTQITLILFGSENTPAGRGTEKQIRCDCHVPRRTPGFVL